MQEVCSQVKAQTWLEKLQENLQISASMSQSRAQASKGMAHGIAAMRVITLYTCSCCRCNVLMPSDIGCRSHPIACVRGAVDVQHANEAGDASMAFIPFAAETPVYAAGIHTHEQPFQQERDS